MAVRVASRAWSTTVAVVLAAAVPGLALLATVEPVARWFDTEPGLVEYTVFGPAWNLCVVGVLAVWVTRLEQRPFGQLVREWWQPVHADEHVVRPALLWVALLVLGVVGLSSIRLELVDAGWDLLSGPSWSLNSPTANRGDAGFTVGVGVIAFQLLVRIPLTVFVEESLFRGWVQARRGAVASGVLFAAYHLSQWWTIPALIPFALALSLLRVVTRSIWPGAAVHYAGNAVYALSLG